MERLPNVAKNITTFDKVTSIARLTEDAPQFFSVVQNWYDVLIFYFGGCKNQFTLKFRSGYETKITKLNDLLTIFEHGEVQKDLIKSLKVPIKIGKNRVTFNCGGRYINFYYKKEEQLLGAISAIKSTFLKNEYGWLEVNNKVVLDIGAHIGDTGIYFALKDAYHVYCFEPYPYSYRLAKRNIGLNNLKEKITVYNEACGGRNGNIILDPKYSSTGGSNLKNFERGTRIKIETLDNIVKKLELRDAVLKLDCEGYEYGIILKSKNKTLRSFESIILEYHYGYLNLQKRLRAAGFKVWHNGPRKSINCYAKRFKMTNGLMFAERLPMMS